MEEIRTLPFNKKPGARGRPSVWHDGIPAEYVRLLGAGYSHREILGGWDVSETTFKTWLHRSKVLKDAAEESGCIGSSKLSELSSFEEMLERAEPRAIAALLDIANNGKSESARVAAANALLDRKRGKPAQTVEHKASGSFAINVLTAPAMVPMIAYDDIIEQGEG